MNFLANLLSVLSLFFGFVSVIFSLESHFTFAAWSIILSVVFDGLDGQVARINPASSEFGKELDSLADVVSFGIAPSILGYIFIYRDFHLLATAALFFYLFCSVMRLAKYNVTPKAQMSYCFYGVPTTVSGGALASFILIYRRGQEATSLPAYVPVIFLLMVLALALLMVSRLRYLNLDALKRLLARRPVLASLSLLLPAILAAFLRKAGIFTFSLFLIYLLFSPFVVKRLDSTKDKL